MYLCWSFELIDDLIMVEVFKDCAEEDFNSFCGDKYRV